MVVVVVVAEVEVGIVVVIAEQCCLPPSPPLSFSLFQRSEDLLVQIAADHCAAREKGRGEVTSHARQAHLARLAYKSGRKADREKQSIHQIIHKRI